MDDLDELREAHAVMSHALETLEAFHSKLPRLAGKDTCHAMGHAAGTVSRAVALLARDIAEELRPG